GELAQMIAEGSFPYAEDEETGERELSPRVGDGFLQIDAEGVVTYASPNAVSAYRRLGVNANIIGEHLSAIGAEPRQVLDILRSQHPIEDEIEANGAWVLRRFMPVVHSGSYHGAVGLVRDITELRRRDRMLLIKDATIREIHHRVKNNLQTVASLLRLQSRRLGTSEARAELEESVRRISSIALVHEMLSQDSSEQIEFDRVARSVLEMAEHTLVRPDRPVRFSLHGSAGDLPSDTATPLSLVLNELIQNAVEHAFPGRGGTVDVELARTERELLVVVRDDGVGLPPSFALETSGNLGMQIVRTLASEMDARLAMKSEGGTRIELAIPLPGA
ncbi:MAG TPA: histidine kinase dimerization/phosphoacceptor domain -containing protein, partial [Actinomycetota bacterium]|nr:histidine kinase dimerization/phosphoacceptor domain -containing protein [Actinomycetota bacterium]